MKDKLIYFFHNYLCYKQAKSDDSYHKDTEALWFKYAFPNSNMTESVVINRNLSILPFNNLNDVQEVKKQFVKNSRKYSEQVIVICTILDINPSIKKSLRYIWELMKIGYKVYILSVNPKSPCSEYFDDYLSYFGIFDSGFLIRKRFRSEKYNPELLEFAAELRQGDPLKYSVIKKLTGIPKSTLISYMKRNGIYNATNETGREKPTDEEARKLQLLCRDGCLVPLE